MLTDPAGGVSARSEGRSSQRYWAVALCAGRVVLVFDCRWVPAEISIVAGLSSFKDENGEVLPVSPHFEAARGKSGTALVTI